MQILQMPYEITLEILAQASKPFYPTISCVSKNLQCLIPSQEIQKVRRQFDKDAIYLYLADSHNFHYGPTKSRSLSVQNKYKLPSDDIFARARVLPDDHEWA